ncbi:MAG: hypothetical protein VR68_16615 [Peptococcaceae bacterium BRH_c4a]|nr:MAG: hypothetical protein VR68_16615 [Peptococcaceae bacterium BRH_c4a]
MITPEQLESYRSGWREYKRQRDQDLASRYRRAMAKTRLAAEHLKRNYKCKVYLFGSMAREDKFTDHSDIDLAVSNLDKQTNFWKLYSEVMNILAPFDFDLVEMERIDPDIRQYILKEGMEL